MANEITVRESLLIVNGNNQYPNWSTVFRADQLTPGGPAPGYVNVPTAGVDIDLSQLTTPGMCVFKNTGSTYTVEIGLRDPDTNKFYAFCELYPGESDRTRLSRYLSTELGVGTGTTGSGVRLHARALVGATTIVVDAFNA